MNELLERSSSVATVRARAVHARADPAPPERRPRVLLIDPDAANREVEVLLVRYYGFEVRGAPDLAEGLFMARVERPDAIVCELFADAPRGPSTVALLRRDPATAGIPVVAITPRGGAGLRERARIDGAVDFLTKPCRGDLLKKILERLLGPAERAAAAGS